MTSLSTMTYPIDIPSIAAHHPALANNSNLVNSPFMQGLFVSHIAGNPLDPLAAFRAEQTARMLGLLILPKSILSMFCLSTRRSLRHRQRRIRRFDDVLVHGVWLTSQSISGHERERC
jgi:hypothetical protein